jgi:AraC-like DNA-binding protein
MPKLAREVLIQRLERSGRLDQLRTDVRILFRKRLHFDSIEHSPGADWVTTPLQVGAVTLGYLSLPASKQSERNTAYQHWLEMACKILTQVLSSPHPHTTDVLPAKITRALRLIKERHHEPISLCEIAAEVGLGRERLCRLFHETLGITFSDYLNEVRLAEARELLATESGNITEVAYASGYQSLSQFNRRFRTAEGRTPSQYREQYAKTPDQST